MYYIEVEMYGGEIFKYIAGKERDARFIKTLADNYKSAVKQINIINLYEKETTEHDRA